MSNVSTAVVAAAAAVAAVAAAVVVVVGAAMAAARTINFRLLVTFSVILLNVPWSHVANITFAKPVHWPDSYVKKKEIVRCVGWGWTAILLLQKT